MKRITPALCALLLLLNFHAGPAAEIGREDRQHLLADRVGFGESATGGLEGPTVHVTTDADAGPGSLREAVGGEEPRWIVFDGDYTIRLASGIFVGSNKTVDGRGRKVTLTGHNQYGLILHSGTLGKDPAVHPPVSNVIIANLILRDFGDTARTMENDPYDAIHIGSGKDGTPPDRIWIDHCDLSMAGDKLIGITGGATRVTVSWTHFHDQEQTFQIGSMSTQERDELTTVTITHCHFDHTGYRNPVISYGKLHSFNNYIVGWRVYAIRAERVAQAYFENNIFEAGEHKRASHTKPAGKGKNDAGTLQDDRPGYLQLVGNLKLNGAKLQPNEGGKVFNPASTYTYKTEVATEALATKIAAGAGWQPALFYGVKEAQGR